MVRPHRHRTSNTNRWTSTTSPQGDGHIVPHNNDGRRRSRFSSKTEQRDSGRIQSSTLDSCGICCYVVWTFGCGDFYDSNADDAWQRVMVLYDGLKYILVYIGGWVGWLERLEEELKVDATTATFDGVLKFF
mmetsp:Transcript_19307/g.22995  ORF Transcript_19307/g.22995 Transcript_19307/m.22995 type:complete len:132 (-) Transcript_19307:171-566(-)